MVTSQIFILIFERWGYIHFHVGPIMCPAGVPLLIYAVKKCKKQQISGLCYPTKFQIELRYERDQQFCKH